MYLPVVVVVVAGIVADAVFAVRLSVEMLVDSLA